MTDTSKYTGSHKERFDESGKGKGIEGREERVENKGYVGAYKGEGTFDEKVDKQTFTRVNTPISKLAHYWLL